MTALVEYRGAKTPEEIEAKRDQILQENRRREREREDAHAKAQHDDEKKRHEAKLSHHRLILSRNAPKLYVAEDGVTPVKEPTIDHVEPQPLVLPANFKGIFPGSFLHVPFQKWLNGRKSNKKLTREFLKEMRIEIAKKEVKDEN